MDAGLIQQLCHLARCPKVCVDIFGNIERHSHGTQDQWRLSSIRMEAAWALSNAIIGGSPEQIKDLALNGCVGALGELLQYPATPPEFAAAHKRLLDALLDSFRVLKPVARTAGSTNIEHRVSHAL